MKRKIINNSGFTIIEMLTVIGIFAVVGTMSVNILFSMMKATSKAAEINKIKQSGDYALSIMERIIRNASSITSGCTNGVPSSSLTIKSVENNNSNIYIINLDTSGIAYQLNPPGGAVQNLINTSDISITGTPQFVCQVGSNEPTLIQIQYSLASKNLTGKEQVTIPFVTSISLRNY